MRPDTKKDLESKMPIEIEQNGSSRENKQNNNKYLRKMFMGTFGIGLAVGLGVVFASRFTNVMGSKTYSSSSQSSAAAGSSGGQGNRALNDVVPTVISNFESFCENISVGEKVKAGENDYITLVFYSDMTKDQCVDFLEAAKSVSSVLPGADTADKITYEKDFKLTDVLEGTNLPNEVLFHAGDVSTGLYVGVKVDNGDGENSFGSGSGSASSEGNYEVGYIYFDVGNPSETNIEELVNCYMSSVANANELTGNNTPCYMINPGQN
eukprot:snap_masked-scaffold_9-processed-gene-9.36-mRNA-1 protein AED:1.00 eAED:1.00 QI:0/0/0/0/1/1/2/0/265